MKKHSTVLRILLLTLTLAVILSCDKDSTKDLNQSGKVPELTTTMISSITAESASSGGIITDDGGSPVTARGVVWSTSAQPTVTLATKTNDGIGIGSYGSNISGLNSLTTYYLRAYATNANGTGYGNEITFTTPYTKFYGSMTDQNGNVYKTITIGTQTWMAENLRVTRYRNFDQMFNVNDNISWSAVINGAYCNYDNTYDTEKIETYGRLYNWFAVEDSRNIAPSGWHVPTDAEWTTLINLLGGEGVAGGKMKEMGTNHWNSPNSGATNESAFSAMPSGERLYNDGLFYGFSTNGNYWTSTKDGIFVIYRNLSFTNAFCSRRATRPQSGFAVRLIKD
ncbi:MAG: fibrobacter succinogenes major paralogous domain-containing protein [Saprospiraceae bacterium]|nr:fibrobacter succinogenes major paralogous domain-containing protein [Saprospiraceae bacterium]